jgi:hypothetical protein
MMQAAILVVAMLAAFASPEPVGDNVVIAPNGPVGHRLFVFLPGTGAKPSEYHAILDEAAQRGYNAIGLAYDNRGTVNAMCARSRDPQCWGNVRGPRAQEIEERLTQALQGLAGGANWGEFVRDGAPDWSAIVLSGHSQGAGEAVFLAKKHRVARVCGFDSPSDGNKHVPVAAWLSNPSATAAGSIFIATNTDDRVSEFALVQSNVLALGLPATNFITMTIPGLGYLESHSALAIDPAYAPVREKACFR